PGTVVPHPHPAGRAARRPDPAGRGVMSPRITGATAVRVLRQLSHDHRTIALLLVVPSVLMTLLRYIFDDPALFDRLAPDLLGLDTAGAPWTVIVVAVANAVLGMALGLFVSAFAQSEFQAVQFMPAVVLPQVLLCGLFAARGAMAGWLQAISNVLPMSYAVE